MKQYADKKRRAKVSDISPGDTVFVRQRRENKVTPYINPEPLTVESRKGSMITARRGPFKITRNVSHFKRLETTPFRAMPADDDDTLDNDDDDGQKPSEDDNDKVDPLKSCLRQPDTRPHRTRRLPFRFRIMPEFRNRSN